MNDNRNKKIWLFFIIFTLTFSIPLSGCQNSNDTSETSSTAALSEAAQTEQSLFTQFTQTEFQKTFENDLISLHFTVTDPSAYGIEEPQTAFPPLTEEYNTQCIKDLKETQKTLQSIDSTLLTETQQQLYETLTHYLEQQIALGNYSQFVCLLSPNNGVSSQLPVTLSEYTFYSEDDVKDYLSMLTQIPDYFTQALEWETNKISSGLSMSDFEIDDTISRIDHFLEETENNLLIETFDERIDSLSDLSADQKNTYKKNNSQLLSDTVFPAFTALREGLLALKGSGGRTQGLSYYDGGEEYYELLIQSMTLSDRTVSQLTKTLEKRMTTIMNRVQTLYAKEPDIYDIMSSHTITTTETPEEMIERLKSSISEDYPALSDVTYQISPIPEALEDNTTAAYYMIPPIDSQNENKIYYNEKNASSVSLFTTLSHEGYPGHLYQNNYFLSTSPDPIYSVLNLTGYKEGWAYYAEIDCTRFTDYGKYDNKYHDSLVELSRCNDEFGYCLSSLIDLYVNGQGYSMEEVGEVLEKYGLDSTSAQSFYEYAIEEPGAYLQYYIGYLEILSLKNTAEKELGDDFTAKEFHTVILETGPCYYSQLEEKIDKWVSSVKK
ncbi:MAG: DUF885 domain-containing protein [Lachnospiraceae bacterium]|nr:DUF885 domain-containing protein [Lachnospiraceae bacterium]